MATNDITFKADKLDFATLDASEREFLTIEYTDPAFNEKFGIVDGKVYLWVVGLTDKFSARLLIEGEKEFAADSEYGEIYQTGEDREPFFLDYAFTAAELDAIKLRLIEYMHCLVYGGESYAIAEMSVPDGQEAWRNAA